MVKEWHSLLPSEWQSQELPQVVASILTEAVTRSLPEPWQGEYTIARASDWIKERDQEGATLLVIDKSNREAIGLMILFEVQLDDGMDVRLGYLLSEATWGRGLASELVEGFVGWCRKQAQISSITGGVSLDNPASKRVLEKNGFQIIEGEEASPQDEQLFRISFR